MMSFDDWYRFTHDPEETAAPGGAVTNDPDQLNLPIRLETPKSLERAVAAMEGIWDRARLMFGRGRV